MHVLNGAEIGNVVQHIHVEPSFTQAWLEERARASLRWRIAAWRERQCMKSHQINVSSLIIERQRVHGYGRENRVLHKGDTSDTVRVVVS